MEPVITKKTAQQSNAITRLHDTPTLKIILASEKLLTKITTKETLLIPQTNNKQSKKKATLESLIKKREKLNIQLKFLITTALEQRLFAIERYHKKLNYIPQYRESYQTKLLMSTDIYERLIQIHRITLKETQQTKQLAERGLIVNEYTLLFPELYPEYELVRNESNELFLKINNNYPSCIEKLETSIPTLINTQDQLKKLTEKAVMKNSTTK
jgi:hypothetical protein